MRSEPVRRHARRAVTAPDVEVDLTSSGSSTDALLPHERDQKVGMTGGIQSHRVQQGARDVKRGLQDTSRAIEADLAYKKLKK